MSTASRVTASPNCICTHAHGAHRIGGVDSQCSWWHGSLACDCTGYTPAVVKKKSKLGRVLDEVVMFVGFALFFVIIWAALSGAFAMVDAK